MALTEADAAAGEATATVAMVERAADRRRNRTRTRAHFDHLAVRIVAHDHAARVAGQAAGRFRRNARAVFQHRLAGCFDVGEHRGVHVNDHLVALARGAGIQLVMQRALGHQRERVGFPLLRRGRRFGDVLDGLRAA